MREASCVIRQRTPVRLYTRSFSSLFSLHCLKPIRDVLDQSPSVNYRHDENRSLLHLIDNSIAVDKPFANFLIAQFRDDPACPWKALNAPPCFDDLCRDHATLRSIWPAAFRPRPGRVFLRFPLVQSPGVSSPVRTNDTERPPGCNHREASGATTEPHSSRYSR